MTLGPFIRRNRHIDGPIVKLPVSYIVKDNFKQLVSLKTM